MKKNRNLDGTVIQASTEEQEIGKVEVRAGVPAPEVATHVVQVKPGTEKTLQVTYFGIPIVSFLVQSEQCPVKSDK